MATITGANAVYGLYGIGTLTGINVSGSARVGLGATVETFSDVDKGYAFKLATTTTPVHFLWNSNTGDVSGAAGTITRWGAQTADTTGEDIEGIDLGGLDDLGQMLIECGLVANNAVTITDGNNLLDLSEASATRSQVALFITSPFAGTAVTIGLGANSNVTITHLTSAS